MRAINIALPPALPKSWWDIYAGRSARLAELGTNTLRSEYLNKHPSWKALKGWMTSLSGGKCWYCESSSRRSPFDVDHFRPKLGVTVDGQALPDGFGYYWLAYEWWNFRLSCQRCNRPEKIDQLTRLGKWNEFPIRDEGTRCAPVSVLVSQEECRFLDPCNPADCELLAHPIDGEVKPAAPPGTWEYERADYTIKQLGLNDWNVPEDRRKAGQGIYLLVKVAGENASDEIKTHIQKYLKGDQEYSSFFQSVIGAHRDRPWIEAILS